MKLYRGEAAFNRRKRTYGMSWSRSKEIATRFALVYGSTYEGGGVLLETVAPPKAVICDLDECGAQAGEQEVLLDRQYIGRVKALKNFPQLPLEEVDRLVAELDRDSDTEG